ncbi:hypothetical protein C8R44DRAFT_735946 [Mycena epipterygia]|nr:hypothetical protein C8R44DRAFT_735946 [Mycena epipterygia]
MCGGSTSARAGRRGVGAYLKMGHGGIQRWSECRMILGASQHLTGDGTHTIVSRDVFQVDRSPSRVQETLEGSGSWHDAGEEDGRGQGATKGKDAPCHAGHVTVTAHITKPPQSNISQCAFLSPPNPTAPSTLQTHSKIALNQSIEDRQASESSHSRLL